MVLAAKKGNEAVAAFEFGGSNRRAKAVFAFATARRGATEMGNDDTARARRRQAGRARGSGEGRGGEYEHVTDGGGNVSDFARK